MTEQGKSFFCDDDFDSAINDADRLYEQDLHRRLQDLDNQVEYIVSEQNIPIWNKFGLISSNGSVTMSIQMFNAILNYTRGTHDRGSETTD